MAEYAESLVRMCLQRNTDNEQAERTVPDAELGDTIQSCSFVS